ncbi:MAG TPA: four-helix bundle copper-binding protein [Amycolatopsis sp.]|uniref:four-helix bundle copper-binding protein n=1 Tax=Amycolatopsis sp. TaxID=37632 RepID=UPI002B478DB3|nr:four-helix bundle copper-binding protein [Amycolatopsis sp.]HKS49158.1 four-helix bundle copper-binding protein [Amycolatopsis sp.]
MTVTEMVRTYPADLGEVDRDAVIRCIEQCMICAQACTACADACMSEPDDEIPMLRKCIRSNEDCADICATTERILSRHTGYDANITRAILDACAVVCRSCGDECERHASRHEHCRICAEACRQCENACRELLGALG